MAASGKTADTFSVLQNQDYKQDETVTASQFSSYVVENADAKDRDDCTLDLFVPQEAIQDPGRRAPLLVVFVHGGLWCTGDKRAGHHIARYLCTHKGWHVACINYRLSAKQKNSPIRHPTHAADVADACAWLSSAKWSNGTALGYSRCPVAFIGHSIGAHTMTMFAMTPDKYPVTEYMNVVGWVALESLVAVEVFCQNFPNWAEVVAFAMPDEPTAWESPVDFALQEITGIKPPSRRFAAPHAKRKGSTSSNSSKRRKSLPSPVTNSQPEVQEMDTDTAVHNSDGFIHSTAPWLLLHSKADECVKLAQVNEMKRVLDHDGIQNTVVILESGGHDEVLEWVCGVDHAKTGTNADVQKATQPVVDFLSKLASTE